MEDGGFQLVSRKKGARSQRSGPKRFQDAGVESWAENEISTCKVRLEAALREVELSAFVKGLYSKLEDVLQLWMQAGVVNSTAAAAAACNSKQDGGGSSTGPIGHGVAEGFPAAGPGSAAESSAKVDIICYGIGPFGQSQQARYQMATLQLIKQHMQDLDVLRCCMLYDPVLQQAEAQIARDLGFQLIEVNEEGYRPIDTATLFFMPHCGRSLYENVLASNWSCQRLQLVSIVGNEFSSYLERMPTRTFESETPHLAHAQRFVTEAGLVAGEYGDSFNDTAIHAFEQGRMPAPDSQLWTCARGEFHDDDHVSVKELTSWRWKG